MFGPVVLGKYCHRPVFCVVPTDRDLISLPSDVYDRELTSLFKVKFFISFNIEYKISPFTTFFTSSVT